MDIRLSFSACILIGALPLMAIAAEPRSSPGADTTTARDKSAGEYVDDAAITAKVKAAFVRDNEVKALDIKVETYRGVVQLSGFARNNAEIQRALEIARNVAGVKSVRNDIQLR